MSNPLPEDIKKRAERKCREFYAYLEVLDPGTVIEAEGRVLVLVRDRATHLPLWLEIQEAKT